MNNHDPQSCFLLPWQAVDATISDALGALSAESPSPGEPLPKPKPEDDPSPTPHPHPPVKRFRSRYNAFELSFRPIEPNRVRTSSRRFSVSRRQLCVVCPPESPSARLVRIAGVHNVLPMFDSLDAAIGGLQAK